MQWKTFTTLWADQESRRYAKREGFNRNQLYIDFLGNHCDHEDRDVYIARTKNELAWYNSKRPYYRVYPCVIEMAKDIRMDAPVRWGSLLDIDFCINVNSAIDLVNKETVAAIRDNDTQFLSIPVHQSELLVGEKWNWADSVFWEGHDGSSEAVLSLLVETPKECDIPSLLVSVTIEGCKKFRANICYNDGKDADGDNAFMTHSLIFNGDSSTIEEIVESACSEREKQIMKLVSLLYMFTDPSIDLMERIVLNKDKGKEVTSKILERAEKATGRGWTIGRKLEELPRKSRPHWGIRWCKPDHEGEVIESWDGIAPESRQGCVPKLRPIRGANENFYRKVPTGHKG